MYWMCSHWDSWARNVEYWVRFDIDCQCDLASRGRMSDQTDMYMSLEGTMKALEHHGLLAPGSTALDFNVRSVNFDPELGGYGIDKPKDKFYGRQVWGAMSQAISTVATTVSEAGSDLYSTVQAAVSSFLNHKADEVLPLRYNAKFTCPVPPPFSESLLYGHKQVRPPVCPANKTQFRGHWRPWQNHLPSTSEYSFDSLSSESPAVMYGSPVRQGRNMAPGHLPYSFPVPYQQCPSHIYGDGWGPSAVPGHLQYSSCDPIHQSPQKDVDGLSVAPGHLLPQAEVLGQQDFFPGSHDIHVSRSIVEDPQAFHANSVARAASPAMDSSVSSQGAMRRKPKKAAYYNGKNSWKDYHAQFELVAILNGWNDETKALELATNLRGSARNILADLDPDQRYHYESLVSALSARFEPDYQADMYLAQIRNRTRQKSESLPELGQAIKRLARYALPSAPSSVRQWLDLTQFTEALNNESLEYAVKQARPKTVDEAVKVAMETEAFWLSRQRRKTHGPGNTHLQPLDPLCAISNTRTHKRRHRKRKAHLVDSKSQDKLDLYQDKFSMPGNFHGDGMPHGAMFGLYGGKQDLEWPLNGWLLHWDFLHRGTEILSWRFCVYNIVVIVF